MLGKKNVSSAHRTIGWIICAFLLVSTLAAMKGVYVTHVYNSGATFGTSNASLSLIAFAINFGLLVRCLHCVTCTGDKK